METIEKLIKNLFVLCFKICNLLYIKFVKRKYEGLFLSYPNLGFFRKYKKNGILSSEIQEKWNLCQGNTRKIPWNAGKYKKNGICAKENASHNPEIQETQEK